ncbi:MAG: hypothetical protein J6386_22995 [Candidatus Synoicihabitans palmerolidicus]|nr:hypothetical protein [Candidatus Synoicihabitans palmerolidicus]
MLSDSGNNNTRWANADYDRLVNEARYEIDPAKRFALYRQAESILMADSPIAPIYFYVNSQLQSPLRQRLVWQLDRHSPLQTRLPRTLIASERSSYVRVLFRIPAPISSVSMQPLLGSGVVFTMTTLIPAQSYRECARRWLRTHTPFSWLDDFDHDYRNWAPEPPIYERLIR